MIITLAKILLAIGAAFGLVIGSSVILFVWLVYYANRLK